MNYFDANATTPLLPEAQRAWQNFSENFWHNPASPSIAGIRASLELENFRRHFAKYFSTAETGVIFTSGATEANNAILAFEAARAPDGIAAVSAIEHPSVLETARKFFGERLRIIPVEENGTARLGALEDFLKNGGVTFVSLMAANNETGVIQPFREAKFLAEKHGAHFHCDATQWCGKMPAHLLGAADYFVASGHKFGAPKGTGVLIFSPEKNPRFAGQTGGGQENHRRAGTVNLPGIAAMAAAFDAREKLFAETDFSAEKNRARADFEMTLLEKIPGAKIFGTGAIRLWNTVSIALPRHENLRWLRRLEKRNFIVSTGSACATAGNKPSHVLAAMGNDTATARRTLRISATPEITEGNWRELAFSLGEILEELDADAAQNSGVILPP